MPRRLADHFFGMRDEVRVVALEHFQEQCVLVAEGGIEAWLVEAGRRRDIVKRGALKALLPEHVAREVERLVGIKAARSCHAAYVRAARAIANKLQPGLATGGCAGGLRNRMRWYSQPIATSTTPRHMKDSAR